MRRFLDLYYGKEASLSYTLVPHTLYIILHTRDAEEYASNIYEEDFRIKCLAYDNGVDDKGIIVLSDKMPDHIKKIYDEVEQMSPAMRLIDDREWVRNLKD